MQKNILVIGGGSLIGQEVISLIQKAPFNDPLYLKIDESHLAIRKETAQHIFVRLKNKK